MLDTEFMSENLYSIWRTSCDAAVSAIVLPDGCRDVIMQVLDGGRPQWFISPLFDRSASIRLQGNSIVFGFRMKPGVEFSEEGLLAYLRHENPVAGEIENALDDFTCLDTAVEDALNCLSDDVESIRQASNRLGVSMRTLQRLLLGKTERSPGYWFQLARVRKAARSLADSDGFAEVAATHGYADQSHMNREFRRWFNARPSAILKRPDILSQLNEKGYG